jgi:ribosomal protein L12E/L44/L45/RPP1/RPP2
MAKPMTRELLRKKIVAQMKVAKRLEIKADNARRTLGKVEEPLKFEAARLEHLLKTPTVDGTFTDEEIEEIAAEVKASLLRAAQKAAAAAKKNGNNDEETDVTNEEQGPDDGADEDGSVKQDGGMGDVTFA